jgi:hypothetical protein
MPVASSAVVDEQEPAPIFVAAKAAVAAGRIQKSTVRGFHDEKRVFMEVPKGAVLVGFDCGIGKFLNIETIYALRAIYKTPQGTEVADDHGLFVDRSVGPKKTTKTRVLRSVRVQAPPGYAVGGITLRTGLNINGLSLTYMKIQGDRLDPGQVLVSNWVGDRTGGGEGFIGGGGAPAVGIFGSQDDTHVQSLGLIFVSSPPQAVQVPAQPEPVAPVVPPVVEPPLGPPGVQLPPAPLPGNHPPRADEQPPAAEPPPPAQAPAVAEGIRPQPAEAADRPRDKAKADRADKTARGSGWLATFAVFAVVGVLALGASLTLLGSKRRAAQRAPQKPTKPRAAVAPTAAPPAAAPTTAAPTTAAPATAAPATAAPATAAPATAAPATAPAAAAPPAQARLDSTAIGESSRPARGLEQRALEHRLTEQGPAAPPIGNSETGLRAGLPEPPLAPLPPADPLTLPASPGPLSRGATVACSRCSRTIPAEVGVPPWCPHCGGDLRSTAPDALAVFGGVAADMDRSGGASSTGGQAKPRPLDTLQPPYFVGRMGLTYRVYILPSKLLFLEAPALEDESGAERVVKGLSLQGGLIGYAIGSTIAGAIASDRRAKARDRQWALDMACTERLMELAECEGTSFMLHIDDLDHVRIEALGFWHHLFAANCSARLRFVHCVRGPITIELPKPDDVRVAIKQLPSVFGEKLSIRAAWDWRKNRFVARS